MVSSNILQRTFYIKYNKFTGTAFTFERNKKQYLATAKHTFPFATNGMCVEYFIFNNNNWISMKEKIFLHENNYADIAILTLTKDISQIFPVEHTLALTLSENAYFLGFPYGKYMEDTQYINNGFPIPYVKKGIISAIPLINNIDTIYLDGINNPGFSGGPCVTVNPYTKQIAIIGVVKGYLPNEIEINTPMGPVKFIENSGIVEVQSIKHLAEIEIV